MRLGRVQNGERRLELEVVIELHQEHGGWNYDDLQTHNLGRFRISVTAATHAVADPLPAAVREIVTKIPAERRTPAQTAAVFSFWRTTRPEFAEANARINAKREAALRDADAAKAAVRGQIESAVSDVVSSAVEAATGKRPDSAAVSRAVADVMSAGVR